MSFKCGFCGHTHPPTLKGEKTPPGFKPVVVVTKRKMVDHYGSGSGKTGTGSQIAEEKLACPECAKTNPSVPIIRVEPQFKPVEVDDEFSKAFDRQQNRY